MLREYGRYWKTVLDQIHARHQSTEKQFQRRLDFAHCFIRACQNRWFLTNIIIGNKVHFSMNSTATKFVTFKCMHQILRLIKKLHQKVWSSKYWMRFLITMCWHYNIKLSDLHDHELFLHVTFFCGVTGNLEYLLTCTNFLRIVVRAIEKRSHLCIENGGRHVELNWFYEHFMCNMQNWFWFQWTVSSFFISS